jgi:hypothetical protein
MQTGFNFLNEPLHSKPVRITAFADSFFPHNRGGEVFYSVKNGNWSDKTTWETVSGRTDKLPSALDDVFIKHDVVQSATTTINNFYISGRLLPGAAAFQITVNGSVYCTGSIDYTGSSVNPILNLLGEYNYIANFRRGNASTVNYNRTGRQYVLALSYHHLNIGGGGGFKYAEGHIDIAGNFGWGTTNANEFTDFEIGQFNLTVGGTTTFPNSPSARNTLRKSGSGDISFGGQVFMQFNARNPFYFSGNPNVEFKGGWNMGNGIGIGNDLRGWGTTIMTGTGTFRASTNNQSWQLATASGGNPTFFGCNILVDNVILTWLGTSPGTAVGIKHTGLIDGTTVGSTFRIGVNSYYNFYNQAYTPMATGVFDFTTNISTCGLGFTFDIAGTYTIPYNTCPSIYADCTAGVAAATTLYLGTANFDCYSLIGGLLTLAKNDSGTVLVRGIFTKTGGTSQPRLNFTTFNTNFELRGGVDLELQAGAAIYNLGTGTWTFTTNNQTLAIGDFTVGGGASSTINVTVNILISGAITVTTTVRPHKFSGTIDGNNANSVFNNLSANLDYLNATAPMVTGKLYANQSTTNKWLYSASGNQDITVPQDPVDPGYRHLTLSGSGAKRLLGSVSVKGTYTLTAPATLDSNGFSLTNP